MFSFSTVLLAIISLSALGVLGCAVGYFMVGSGGGSVDGIKLKETEAEPEEKVAAPKKDTEPTNKEEPDYNKFAQLLNYNNQIIDQDVALRLLRNTALAGVTYKAKNRFGIISAVSISGMQINVEDTVQYREVRDFLQTYDTFSCKVELTEGNRSALVIFEAATNADDDHVTTGLEIVESVKKGVLTGKPIEFTLYSENEFAQPLYFNVNKHSEEYFMLPNILSKKLGLNSEYKMAAMNNDKKIAYQVKPIE